MGTGTIIALAVIAIMVLAAAALLWSTGEHPPRRRRGKD